MGDFADLASPDLVGHSAGVAELATAAGGRCRLAAGDVARLRRAALVHDVGRVAVPVRIWQKRAPLTPDDWERVRLHAYHSERVLARSPFLAALAGVAGCHHERLDGSGYHRGAGAPALGASERVWEHYGIEPAERFMDVHGARLRVLEVGTGEPVLFVHGTGGPGTWPSLVAELSGCRCLLLDRPGWGLSAPLDYSRHEYSKLVADLLREVLGALGLDRAHVVGSSIGNNWALRLAERHPDRVGRVAMLGGGPLVDDVTPPVFIRLLASPLGRVIAALPQRPRMLRAQLRGIGHGASLDAGRIPDEFFDWREALTRHTRSMPSERAMVRAIVRGRSFRPGLTFGDADLGRIQPPALLVYGTADPVGTVETWRRFAAALPRGELQIVDGAGHAPWFDDPGRVAGELRRFLAGR